LQANGANGTNGGEGTSNDSGVESTDSRNTTPTPANSSNYSGILTLINQQKVRSVLGIIFFKTFVLGRELLNSPKNDLLEEGKIKPISYS